MRAKVDELVCPKRDEAARIWKVMEIRGEDARIALPDGNETWVRDEDFWTIDEMVINFTLRARNEFCNDGT